MGATLMVSRQRKDKGHGIACRHVFKTPPRASLDCGGPIVTPGIQPKSSHSSGGKHQPGAVAMALQPSLPMAQISSFPMRDRRVDGLVGYARPLAMLISRALLADLDLPSGAAGSKNRESGRAEVDSGRGQDHLSVAAIFSGICRNFLIEGPCLTTTIVD